jgi:hypothetical protein
MKWMTKRALGSLVVLGTVMMTGVLTSSVDAKGGHDNKPHPADDRHERGEHDQPPAALGQPKFPADAECGTFSGSGCAPTGERIDINRPRFSDPTNITNPLFPISVLESTVFVGEVDGKPFRSETTRLPETGVVILDGKPVEVVLSQYTAYLDGRITEVALDRYAQADDGSVWYLGEDVMDYTDGSISVSEGTWLAGRDGPAAMIMPAEPEVGQVFRAEDIPGVVFEEVSIANVGQTVDGPLGAINGAITGQELRLDGSFSAKTFAPGYGEFISLTDSSTESLAVSVPADRASDAEPIDLAKLQTATWGLVESARLEDWPAADATLARIKAIWARLTKMPQPVRIAEAVDSELAVLTQALAARQSGAITNAAVDVAQSALDLTLRYRTVTFVDIERFHLHAQQLRVDAAAGDNAGVAAEVATLEWIRDRITDALDDDELQTVDDSLAQLRDAAAVGNFGSAADQAARLASLVRQLSAS